MPHYPKEIEYSEKYEDDVYEYKHVLLPETTFRTITKGKILSEEEWRQLGIKQSRGWNHYAIYKPEPHILLFRRPIGTNPTTGEIPVEMIKKIEQRNRDIANN